jgi:2,4-dienoyl-CoA reductase (NADPH2)
MSGSGHEQLFRAGHIGSVSLKNRLIMGPMHVRLEEQEDGWRRLAAFYEERAANDVACIITGGYAPDPAGRFDARAHVFDDVTAARFAEIVPGVRRHGARFFLQILHTGRSGFHDKIVAPSAVRSPINGFVPTELTEQAIEGTLDSFAACAVRAQQAGFDGVEVMGCEGYLISQFLTRSTNQRRDRWGGPWAARCAFAVELVERVRRAVGKSFAIVFRLSFLDLVTDGSAWAELLQLVAWLEDAGVDALHAGIGWQESRVPTVSSLVPDGAFGTLHARVRAAARVPIIAAVKMHTAEKILEAARDHADFVCVARPFLADSALAAKLADSKRGPINPCLSCNQACLDHIFTSQPVSCLTNPRAGNENRFDEGRAFFTKRVLVIGGGPAGMVAACAAAKRGHRVVLVESQPELGGLLRSASRIPGKERFNDTIGYYAHLLRELGVEVRLRFAPDVAWIRAGEFQEVLVATGTRPNPYRIPGDLGQSSLAYDDFLHEERQPDSGSVVIVGAGKIAVDVALYLAKSSYRSYFEFWGVDLSYVEQGGGVVPKRRVSSGPSITVLQRGTKSYKRSLAPTTGWSISEILESYPVRIERAVVIDRMDHGVILCTRAGATLSLRADRVVYCTGQVAEDSLFQQLRAEGIRARLVGSASMERGANAQLAFADGYRVGCSI